MSFKEEAVKYKYYRKSVTVKTDSAWLRGRDKEADIVASPLPSTSTSTCANGCLGVVTIFGTAPLAQQSLTAGSGSKCNTGLKISNTNLRLAAVAFCHIQRSPRMADNSLQTTTFARWCLYGTCIYETSLKMICNDFFVVKLNCLSSVFNIMKSILLLRNGKNTTILEKKAS